MNTLLWILQIILSIKSLSAAVAHFLQRGKPEIETGRDRLGTIAPSVLVVSAGLMPIAALGLLAPAAPWCPNWIAPASAGALMGMLLLSIPFHARCRESPNVIVGAILAVLAAILVYGRWAVVPF